MAKADIKIDVDHNVVTISAKRSSQTSSKPEGATEDDADDQVCSLTLFGQPDGPKDANLSRETICDPGQLAIVC